MTDQPVSPAPTPAELIAFLNGSGKIDGVNFGDRHPARRGAFWWRQYLPVLATPTPAPAVLALPDVDEFAQHIRWLNGSNKMGAGALAEKLLEWLSARVQSSPPVTADRRLLKIAYAALEQITEIENQYSGTDWVEIDEARRIARGAIASIDASQGLHSPGAPQAPQQAGCPECIEQARLLGMGSEREAALMAEVERLKRGNAAP